MKVLFLQNVKGLGKVGEVKEINVGYAQNFLIPRKLFEPAAEAKIAKLKSDAKTKVDEKKVHVDLLLKEIEKISGETVIIPRKVNSTGALFGAVHIADIRDAIRATHGVSVSEEYIHLSKDIKTTGEFEIKVGDKIKLGKEFPVTVKITGQ